MNRVEFEMPKLKTNRGAAKRFRRTATGFKHRKAFRNHILTKKAPKRKRQLRGLENVSAADTKMVTRMLPKKAR
jgi:large subunit ribosomal protein L35